MHIFKKELLYPVLRTGGGSTSKRLLVENDTVPEVLRTARYRMARKMGTKLGQQLLTTRFPPKKRIPPKVA
jgi:hypothetical protein